MTTESTSAITPQIQQLAEYIAGAARQPLPDAVQEKTKHHVLDTIAAMVSGAKLLPGRRAIAYAKSRGGVEEATVVGTKLRTTIETAALANGMLAHSDETDDSHAASQTHPGCGIVPAALAMAERERRGGTAFLRAVALGYDVGTRFTMCLNAYEFREEGHSTHSFGPTFGAAAAAGSLARVNARQARHLITYAGQQASGVGSWIGDLEHIEKAFDFGGMPARNGVTAASFLQHSFTATDDIFAGPRNFFMAYGHANRRPDVNELVRELGSTFEIMRTNIKRWSVGSPIQAPLDSLLDLIREHGVAADDVEHVEVRVAPAAATTTDNRLMPDICMQHMCAVMLLDGIVTFESAHDEPRMHDPRVLELRRRIDLVKDEELQKVFPSRQGIVELTLKDGRRLRHHTKAVRGTDENPMSRAEVDEKAYHLLAPVLGKRKARTLCDTVWALEDVKDLRKLRPLLG
ncbi:MAG: MmgE/PrpD family protein [Chloroflexi bacterium]|nr:MmgE/PrpD family protein [Chloroflexota bacterium]